MLFKFLKLFGHPRHHGSVKAPLDLRFEHAKDVFTRTPPPIAPAIAAKTNNAAITAA